MWEELKGAGLVVGGIAILVGMFLVGVLLLRGAVWVGERVYPWLIDIAWIFLAISVLILAPLALLRRTRQISAIGFLVASFAFGATAWVLGLLLTYSLWGLVALIIGLAMVGIGVVPIAMLATLFNGKWEYFFELVVLVVLTFGCRFLALYLSERAERESFAGYQ